MNFYTEIAKELNAAGLFGEVISVPDEFKPVGVDFADLEKKIAIRVRENEIMMAESELLAARTALY